MSSKQLRAMHDGNTGENIAGLLKEAVIDWKLEVKDPIIVTDNTTIYGCRGWACTHIRCFAHGLKLPTVEQLLNRIRHVTTIFRCRTIASHQLKHKQDPLQLLKLRLITEVVRRWKSSFDMIKIFRTTTSHLCSTPFNRGQKGYCRTEWGWHYMCRGSAQGS